MERWLDTWLPEVLAEAAQRPILELGCGACVDTAYLESRGMCVVAGDLNTRRLAVCMRKLRCASLLGLDLRAPLPFASNGFAVVVASLCLHYFTWSDTRHAVQEIRRCLIDGGLLLCRLNSTQDVYFGAVGHPAINPASEGAYYQVGGRPKRFFDEASVRALFTDGWRFESLEEQTINRYERPKVIWTAALRKSHRS